MDTSVIANLASSFLARAAAAPDRPALVFERSSVSYGNLATRAGQIAAWILGACGGEGARVGILAQRSPDTYAGILGACMAGAAYVPIGVDLPVARQVEMLRRARVSALVSDRTPPPEIAALHGVDILSPQASLGGHPPAPQPVRTDTPAYLMFTSGTTGVPKAVVVTAGNVAHFLGAIRERWPLVADDRVSQFYDITFDLSVLDIFGALSAGASLHVVPTEQRMTPAAFIRARSLTAWSSVPSVIGFLSRVSQLAPGAFPSLRLSGFCGEPLTAPSAEAWRRAAPNSLVDNHYGPTEATVFCLAELVTAPPRVTEGRGVMAIGTPLDGTRAAIVDSSGRGLPIGQIGELALSGPQVAAGYFDDPEQTGRRFPMLSCAGEAPARWYLTGDLAYQDGDGHFHHLGRIDHQVKILGHRVELEEIEAHLRAATGGDAAAIAWPLKDGAPVGVTAFVAGGEWTMESVREALARRLPSYMMPQAIFRRDVLPLSANGKLDRNALRLELARMPHDALA